MDIFYVMLHGGSFFHQLCTNIAGDMHGLMHSFDMLLQYVVGFELLLALITQEHSLLLVKLVTVHFS